MNFMRQAMLKLSFRNSNRFVTGRDQVANAFHLVASSTITSSPPTTLLGNHALLNPNSVIFGQFRGLKVQKVARKRCKSCYLVWKDGRVFNYCKAKPRHNHASIIKKDIERLIITHYTFGTARPW